MNTNRKTAIIVGALFIIGTVAGILSVVFTMPILNASDYLAKVAVNGNHIIIGALLILTMGFENMYFNRKFDNFIVPNAVTGPLFITRKDLFHEISLF